MARYAWPRRHEGHLPSLVLASVATFFLVAAVALAVHLLATARSSTSEKGAPAHRRPPYTDADTAPR